LAKYPAKKKAAPIEIVPLEDSPDGSTHYAFEISMGVRKSDKALRDKLDEALVRKRDEIRHVLEEFGVPLLPVSEEKAGDQKAH